MYSFACGLRTTLSVRTSTFAGLLTTSDYINVIQYYWQNPDALAQVDQFRLNSLRDIEKAIGVQPIETVSVHPLQSLYTACRRMLESRARRIPLVDVDDETQRAMIVSVLTQYRILKFVAVNVKDTQNLRKPLRDIDCGTYGNLQTATMETPVMDVIHLLVKYSISNVPILDSEGTNLCSNVSRRLLLTSKQVVLSTFSKQSMSYHSLRAVYMMI